MDTEHVLDPTPSAPPPTTSTALVVPSSGRTELVSAKAVSKMHNPSDLVALASYVQDADMTTKAFVSSKLEMICDQIRALQVCGE